MTYATLLVHLELGRSNAGLLQIAATLADRFRCAVIGIAARQPLQMVYGDGFISGDVYELDRIEVAKALADVETEFRTALYARSKVIEWRSSQAFALLSDYLAQEARSADLVLTSSATGDFLDASRTLNLGDLIMRAGRPVMIVPSTAPALRLERVLVAWNDSREARRAVSDALPLLRQANHVNVVELAPEKDLADARAHVRDVVAWLKRHDIAADGSAALSTGDDANALQAIGQDDGADVIVAGAYGHSRLREWALGGVTRNLLLSGNTCAFVSH